MIKVSIIIVNYRSWPDLIKCLTSLKKISFKQNNIEIIVVDNQSQDGKFNEFSAKFPENKFILNSGNFGFSQACNLGASHASGKYLLFLNPDTEVSENTFEVLLSLAHKHPDYKLISCKKVNLKGIYEKTNTRFPTLLTFFGIFRAISRKFFGSKKKGIQDSEVIFPDWLSGSLVLMSQEWYDKLGGWNEDYWMYYEDVDLSYRTVKLNGKIALINNVEIIHNHGGSTRINITTKALTKAEVIISRHVYVQNNFTGVKRIFTHLLLLTSVIINKLIIAMFSLFFCFIPKLRVNLFIFKNLLSYYVNALRNQTWLSQHSVNFIKHSKIQKCLKR